MAVESERDGLTRSCGPGKEAPAPGPRVAAYVTPATVLELSRAAGMTAPGARRGVRPTEETMNRSRTLSKAALLPAAVTLAASAGPGDEAAFHPGRHAILTKAFAEDLEVELDSFEVRVDGEPMEEGAPDVRVKVARRVTLGDDYLDVEAGRVKKLTRTHELLSGEAVIVLEEQGEREEHTATLASDLEESVVLFEWNEERGEYDRKFEEGGTGNDEHLARLEPDADFLGFLPEGAVDEDDTWQVDAAALGRVLAPGGDVRLIPSSLGEAPYINLEMPGMIGAALTSLGEAGDAWKGTVKAKYAGAREEDGVRLGRIELEVEATCEADLQDACERAVEALAQDFEFTFTGMELDWKLSGRGELLWDLNGGHVHAFKLDSEVEIEARLSWKQPVLDQEVEIEAVYRLSGTARSTLALER